MQQEKRRAQYGVPTMFTAELELLASGEVERNTVVVDSMDISREGPAGGAMNDPLSTDNPSTHEEKLWYHRYHALEKHHFRKDRNSPLNMLHVYRRHCLFPTSPSSLLPQSKPRLIITTVFPPLPA